MSFAEKITQLRKKQGWSQEELAERMNVTRQSVSKWESSQSMPDLEKILSLSKENHNPERTVKINRKEHIISSLFCGNIYWLLVVIVQLVYCFVSDQWLFSGVIWLAALVIKRFYNRLKKK